MTGSIIQVGGPDATPSANTMGGLDCNQYLVKDPKSNLFDIVDAGLGTAWDAVAANVAKVMPLDRVRNVFVTHEHLDHVNGLPHWQTLGATIHASAPAAEKLRAGHDPTSAAFGHDIPTLVVDTIVADGDHIQLGGSDFTAIATPGHCPGSMCLWDEGDAVLFSGDVVFADGGIGRFDFPDSDLRQHLEAILRLGRLPVRALHCGHGPSPQGDAAKRSLRASISHVQACAAEAGLGSPGAPRGPTTF